MNLMELFVKVGVDDQASGKIGGISDKLKGGLATAAKVGAAAVTAASAAVGKLVKDSVQAYAEYEQLVGGVETLFKNSADVVQGYADQAYKTAGLSANEYMQTVTSFSASLLQGLGGDTEKAAEYANTAIVDMADNANKMGTSMEAIQNAYQGFAKQNYTMLDNLKLGYGGTKTEMERLIQDAARVSDSVDAESMSFDNIVEAIHVMQEEMGIAGTTSKEASTTIQGSIGMMKGAWTNLVTGFTNENANLDKLLDEFVESVGTAAENLIPAIERALSGIGKVIEKLAPVISEKLPKLVEDVLPSLLNAAVSLISGIIDALPSILQVLIDQVPTIITTLIDKALEMLPQIIQLGLDLIISLAKGIADNLDTLIPSIIDAVLKIVETLLAPESLEKILNAGLQLILSLVDGIVDNIDVLIDGILQAVDSIIMTLLDPSVLIGIIDAGIKLLLGLVQGIVSAIPQLIHEVPKIIASIVTVIIAELPTIIAAAIDIVFALIDGLIGAIPELVAAIPNLIIGIVNGIVNNLDKIILAGPQIILALIKGLIGAIPELVASLPRIIMSIVNTFKEYDWGKIGKNIVQGLKKGISDMWEGLKKWFNDKLNSLVGGVKKLLGIHSPSTVFAGIGKNMALGVGEGWDKTFGDIQDEINKSMDFDDVEFGIATARSSVGGGSSSSAGGVPSKTEVVISVDESQSLMGFARALLPMLKVVEREVYA